VSDRGPLQELRKAAAGNFPPLTERAANRDAPAQKEKTEIKQP